MKIINNEFKINLFKSKYLSIIIILQLTLVFVLIGVFAINLFSHYSSYNDFYNIFKDNSVYNVIDIGGTEIYADKMNLDNIDNISALDNELDGKYKRICQIINQFEGEFDSNKIDFMNIDRGRIESYKNMNIAPYKSMRVNNNFFDLYQINLSEGDFFSIDYKYMLGDTIPVILGSAYKDYYEIGSVFIGNYFLFDKNSSYEVIGFLKDGTKYFNLNLGTYVSLDHYILVPDVDIDKHNSYREEVIIANYAQRIPSVYLAQKEELSQFKNIIKEHNLESMYRVDNQRTVVEKIYHDSQNLTAMMLISFIFLSLFSLIIISMNCFRRISMNFRRYAIHLANGASKKDIIKLILSDLFIILIISDILGIGINIYFAINNLNISSEYIKYIFPVSIVVIVFSIIIYLIIYLIVKLRINKFKTVDFIRRLQP